MLKRLIFKLTEIESVNADFKFYENDGYGTEVR